MLQKYFESDYLQLSYDQEEGYVFADWRRFPLSPEFRAGMDKIIDCMKESGVVKLLSDTRNMGAIDPDDQDWSIQDWLPRAFGAKYRRFAILVSDDIFNQISVQDVLNRVPGMDFATKYVKSVEEGREWLKGEK